MANNFHTKFCLKLCFLKHLEQYVEKRMRKDTEPFIVIFQGNESFCQLCQISFFLPKIDLIHFLSPEENGTGFKTSNRS